MELCVAEAHDKLGTCVARWVYWPSAFHGSCLVGGVRAWIAWALRIVQNARNCIVSADVSNVLAPGARVCISREVCAVLKVTCSCVL